MSERNVPEVRFRGFSGEWEHLKLLAVAEFNPKAEIPDAFEYVDLESVVGTQLVGSRKENKKTAPSRAQRVALQGDVFYQTVRPYQKNNYMFDMSCKNYVFSTGYTQLRPFGDSCYLLSFLQNAKFVKKVLGDCTGTSYPAINSTTLSNILVSYAQDKDEQTKIGDFFKNLDNLIAQNQKKYDKLVNMKKACLDKMFPKDGADTPEVRFRGFSGEWEKKILKAISLNTYGGGTPNTSINEFWSGYIPWIQSSDLIEHDVSSILARKKISNLAVSKSATKIIPKDSIAVVTRVGVGKLAVIPFQYATSQDFLSLSDLTVDKWFVVYSLYRKLQNELQQVQGTSIKGITKDELLKKSLLVSQSTTEQAQIGAFFQTLDSLIVLRKTKLEKLKNIKKACLDKMFI